jgi:hypothetical protein
MKNYIKLAAQFGTEYAKWLASGGKYRSQEQIDQIYQLCSSNTCGKFINHNNGQGECGICGCNLTPNQEKFNKIAWDSTHCPHNPSYWGVDGVHNLPVPNDLSIKEEAPEPSQEPTNDIIYTNAEPLKETKKVGGCGCGR